MTSVFVVGFDRERIVRPRRIARRIRVIGGSIIVLLWLIVVGLSVFLLPDEGWSFILPAIVGVATVGYLAWYFWRDARRRKRWDLAVDVPSIAMRMSPAALELFCEGASAPVVLPWQVVPGFRLRRRFGFRVLELASRVPAATPGVTGLEQPAAALAFGGRRLRRRAGFYSVRILDQPIEAIDAALRHFSAGRAFIAS